MGKGKTMTREDAIAYWKPRYEHIIEFLEKTKDEPSIREYAEAIDMAIEALQSNMSQERVNHESTNDLISRADAMGAVQDHFNADGFKGYDDGQKMMDRIKTLPSADADWIPREHFDVLKKNYDMLAGLLKEAKASAIGAWIPCSERLPSEDGQYLVFYEGAIIGSRIEIMWYCEPSMSNVDVSGKHFHRSDDEWGDIIYDEVIAWMPLPKPYKGGDDE